MVDDTPYENVRGDKKSFSLPHRKWRELLFVGAMKKEGELYVRDPSRPLPPFRDPDYFAEGVGFRVRLGDDGWVYLTRADQDD